MSRLSEDDFYDMMHDFLNEGVVNQEQFQKILINITPNLVALIESKFSGEALASAASALKKEITKKLNEHPSSDTNNSDWLKDWL